MIRVRIISYASAGVGSTNHLCAELFRKMAHVDIFHVPYKGGGPEVVDLVGDQVMIFFTGYTNVAERVKTGRLILLAVTESKRAPYLPNVPTVGEFLPGSILFALITAAAELAAAHNPAR